MGLKIKNGQVFIENTLYADSDFEVNQDFRCLECKRLRQSREKHLVCPYLSIKYEFGCGDDYARKNTICYQFRHWITGESAFDRDGWREYFEHSPLMDCKHPRSLDLQYVSFKKTEVSRVNYIKMPEYDEWTYYVSLEKFATGNWYRKMGELDWHHRGHYINQRVDNPAFDPDKPESKWNHPYMTLMKFVYEDRNGEPCSTVGKKIEKVDFSSLVEYNKI